MLKELGRRMDEQSQKFLTELENIKKNQTELKNAITEIKNTLEEINKMIQRNRSVN